MLMSISLLTHACTHGRTWVWYDVYQWCDVNAQPLHAPRDVGLTTLRAEALACAAHIPHCVIRDHLRASKRLHDATSYSTIFPLPSTTWSDSPTSCACLCERYHDWTLPTCPKHPCDVIRSWNITHSQNRVRFLLCRHYKWMDNRTLR